MRECEVDSIERGGGRGVGKSGRLRKHGEGEILSLVINGSAWNEYLIFSGNNASLSK